MEAILGSNSRQIGFHIRDSSDVAAARRAGNHLAMRIGMNDTAAGRVALAVMEAATNIVKHAGQGELLLRPLRSDDTKAVEILAIDAGPGIPDLDASMQDGVSTVGSYGGGLGAMRRAASDFDVYTQADMGTVVWLRVGSIVPRQSLPWQLGVVCLPMAGEDISGDAWAVCGDADHLMAVVADGLGHGPDAALASEAATTLLKNCSALPPGLFMQDLHTALQRTRGAAVGVARMECRADRVLFAGVGNIASCIVDPRGRQQLISHNGIVGSNIRKVQEVVSPWGPDSTLILHSDGLASKWNLDQYPGLLAKPPPLIAAILYRDFSRKRDDVAVLVIREDPAL
jgi:anti-sigma regulatory factor (Ser/Thr protein kinase)